MTSRPDWTDFFGASTRKASVLHASFGFSPTQVGTSFYDSEASVGQSTSFKLNSELECKWTLTDTSLPVWPSWEGFCHLPSTIHYVTACACCEVSECCERVNTSSGKDRVFLGKALKEYMFVAQDIASAKRKSIKQMQLIRGKNGKKSLISGRPAFEPASQRR